MALFDSATSLSFGAPSGTLGAWIRYATTGAVLRARQTGAVTADAAIPGASHYRVQMTAASGLQLDTDWTSGVQLVLDDTVNSLVYDLDPLIAAERERLEVGGGGGALTAEQAEMLDEIHRGIQSIGAAPAFV